MKAVNLLPEKDRRRRPTGAQSGSAYAVVGALALLLVAVVVYSITANQVTSRNAEAQKVGREADEAEARAAKLGAFGAFAEMKQTRTASVKRLAAGRFDWERMLREVSRVLPTGVFVTELDASATGADQGAGGSGASASGGGAAGSGGAGAGSTPGAGGATAQPRLTVSGCAPDQSDVATTMVRLRQLHRAEDVTLAESTREDEGQAGGGTADGCGQTRGRPNFAFTATVLFEPAPTTGDDPRDLRRVPSSLGGGS